jgi:thiamine-phosphate pyrophosphorylase
VIAVTAEAVVGERVLLERIEKASALELTLRSSLAVMLRDPELDSKHLLALGERLRAATRAVGVSLLVNDRLDLARYLEADGIHLGRLSVAIADARAWFGDRAWISVACHAPGEVARAEAMGANAALLSPIFASPGKGAPLGLAALGEARAGLADPSAFELIALGGVDMANARACLAAGATGVAAIRADFGEILRALLQTEPGSIG